MRLERKVCCALLTASQRVFVHFLKSRRLFPDAQTASVRNPLRDLALVRAARREAREQEEAEGVPIPREALAVLLDPGPELPITIEGGKIDAKGVLQTV